MRFNRGEAGQDTRQGAIAVGPAETEYVGFGEVNLLQRAIRATSPGRESDGFSPFSPYWPI